MTNLGVTMTEGTSPGKKDLGSRPAEVIMECGYRGEPGRRAALLLAATSIGAAAGACPAGSRNIGSGAASPRRWMRLCRQAREA
jgi:hypothetical protein